MTDTAKQALYRLGAPIATCRECGKFLLTRGRMPFNVTLEQDLTTGVVHRVVEYTCSDECGATGLARYTGIENRCHR